MFENFETWIQLELTQKANCRCVTRTENKCNNHLPNMISFVCFFCVVIRFFHPRRCQWPPTLKDFYTRSYPLHYFLILILEKEPVFPFQCWVLNKGTTGTMFITPLVWRGPWLGIEPGTSRTRSQHSTTRLSRRRYLFVCGDIHTVDWETFKFS